MGLEIDSKQFDGLLDRARKELGKQAQSDLLDRVALRAHKELIELTPADTSNTRRHWTIKSPDEKTREIVNSSAVMLFLEEGTRDHGPVNDAPMRFKNKLTGEWVSTWFVRGIQPHHIVANYVNDLKKLLTNEILGALFKAGVA